MSAGMEYTLKPIGQQSVVWNVIDQLTQAMTMGKLRPGDKIPTETELSESLQVSRNSVRDAVKILVAYGILEIRRAEGTFIRSGVSQQMLNPLIYGIMFTQGDSYRQLKEFRQMIEIAALRLAIRHKTEEKLAELKQVFEDFIQELVAESPSLEVVMQKDMAFHMEIAAISDNVLMQEVSRLLFTLTTAKRTEVTKRLLEHDRHYLIESHTRTYEAVVHGDSRTCEDQLEAVIRPDYYGD